jgi:hypothetical protein
MFFPKELKYKMIEVEEKIPEGKAWWCISVIPATQETEIKRIMVGGQPSQKVSEILS